MSQDVLIAPVSPAHETEANRPLLWAAWGIVLLIMVPEIVLRGFMQLDTPWMAPARLGLLAALLALGFVWRPLRPLRGFVLILLVVYFVEGWFFLTFLPQTGAYQNLVGGDPNLAFFGERLLRIGAVGVMLPVLLVMGLKPREFFLRIGNLRAAALPEKWGVPRKQETWTGFSLRFVVIIAVLLSAFMIPALQPSLDNLSIGLVLFAALCALLNAFAEEFLYRSALLPQVLPVLGKGRALLLVAAWFGLGHFFAVPSGITGVILTAFGGWVFAKSMVETEGLFWPVFMHWGSDFTIYLIMLLAGAL